MEKEHTARVYGSDLPISTKVSVEICKFIKNKDLNKSRDYLQKVLEKKVAIPYKRYNKDTPHRPGKMAAGRYPQKASKEFIKLLNLLQANAEHKGLDSDNLIIYFASANKAARIPRYGRHRGRVSKRTHIELRVMEKEEKEEQPRKTKKVKEEPKEEKAENGKEKVKEENRAPEGVEG